MEKFKENSLVIWDSHFGYEYAKFIKDADEMCYNTYQINLISGNSRGFILVPKEEVFKLSKELVNKLDTQYEYPMGKKTLEARY